MSERDTHFQGFAKLLWEELESFRDSGALRDMTWDERLIVEQEIIARRAYDLMEHIMLYAPVSPVPDMTEWPEEPT